MEGLARLRQLYLQGGGAEGQPGGASIVYIPAHKSHLDYLMLRCGRQAAWMGLQATDAASDSCLRRALPLPAQSPPLPRTPASPALLSPALPAASPRSYVLFGAGLPCPHIAAGANLRLPLVGR